MDDVLVVGSGDAAGDLQAVIQRLAQGEGALGEALAQGAAAQKLGDQVGQAVLGADVVDGQDVGVADGASGAGLLLEAKKALGIAGELLGKDLDGDVVATVFLAQPGAYLSARALTVLGSTGRIRAWRWSSIRARRRSAGLICRMV